jgi:hypothetical protein
MRQSEDYDPERLRVQLSADGSKLQGMVILLTQLADLVVFNFKLNGYVYI